MALSDSRNYLQERAISIGRPNLFTPAALNLVIDGSRGLPRLLRSIAHLAFFAAASEGASQIGAQHVSHALQSRSVDGRIGDVDRAETLTQFDGASRTRPKLGSDPLTPRATFENEKRNTDATAQLAFGIDTKETEGPLSIGHKHTADAPDVWVSFNANKKKRADYAQSALSGEAIDEAGIRAPSISPGQNRSSRENVAAKPVKEFRRLEQRSTTVWTPRVIGAFGALAASIAIGAAIPFILMKPNEVPRAAIAPLTITRPGDLTKAAMKMPALAKQTTSSAGSPPQTPVRKDTAVANGIVTKPTSDLAPTSKVATTQEPGSNLTASAQSEAEVAVKTPVVANTAVRLAPEDSSTEQAAALKPIGDKARTEAEDANRRRAVSDQTPGVINSAGQTTRGNDAAEHAAALKAAEDNAAEERAAADRAKAADQAFLLAQESDSQAKAARAAAERAKAEKVAQERANAARHNAIRVLH